MYNHNFQFFMYSASNLQKRVFTNKVHRVQSTVKRVIPYGLYTADIRPIYGRYTAYRRPIYGRYTAYTRPIYGRYTADIRLINGIILDD